MNTKKFFLVLVLVTMLAASFADSAQAKGDFCTKHPSHWKCQEAGGSDDDNSEVDESTTTETTIGDGDQIVDGPGNTVIVCQAHNHGKFNEHPVSARNAANYIKKHKGSYLGHCKNSDGGDDQDDDTVIIIVDDDDEQDNREERERRKHNEEESFGFYTGVYTTTLYSAAPASCYNDSYINGDENIVIQICGDNNNVTVNYGDSQQAASMLDVTNANISMARSDLDVLMGQVQLLNEQMYNNAPDSQDMPVVDLTWLKTPLWVLVIGLIMLGFLAIAAYLLNSWLHRPLPVPQPVQPPASDIELAHVALPQGYPHTGK